MARTPQQNTDCTHYVDCTSPKARTKLLNKIWTAPITKTRASRKTRIVLSLSVECSHLKNLGLHHHKSQTAVDLIIKHIKSGVLEMLLAINDGDHKTFQLVEKSVWFIMSFKEIDDF